MEEEEEEEEEGEELRGTNSGACALSRLKEVLRRREGSEDDEGADEEGEWRSLSSMMRSWSREREREESEC